MKGRKSKAVLLLFCFLASYMLAGQNTEPFWTDPDVRHLKYSSDRFYTGYAITFPARNESVDNAIFRAKQNALAELTERIRVTVNTRKQASVLDVTANEIDEKIRSIFSSVVTAEAQAEIVGSKIEAYYNRRTNEISAFAYVSKTDLAIYYRNQIDINLSKAETAFMLSQDLLDRKEKGKAYRQCEESASLWGKAVYAQELLSVIDPESTEHLLQRNRTEDLHLQIVRLFSQLENSINIFIGCDNQTVLDILPSLLVEEGCNCNFVENASEADYIIDIKSSVNRTNYADGGLIFCYVKSVLSIHDTNTNRVIKPRMEEVKAGHTTNKAATQKAFENLAKEVAWQVIQTIH